MSVLISRSASASASSLVIVFFFLWKLYIAPALTDRTLAMTGGQVTAAHIIRHSDLDLALALSIAVFALQHLAPFTWHC
jgi:ABC-type spermidine/putrescine transport system permease subunit I